MDSSPPAGVWIQNVSQKSDSRGLDLPNLWAALRYTVSWKSGHPKKQQLNTNN